MERLQTGLLYQFEKKLLSECMGRPVTFPDEKEMSLEEAVLAGGALLEDTFRHIHVVDGGIGFLMPPVKDMLKEWDFACNGSEQKTFTMLPYENLTTGKKEWMPEALSRAYYFTNGSCAGNTKKEALIQGLSEILERYATDRIMVKRLTPPVIPDEKLKEIPSLWNIIEKMRSYENYSLRIVDASCGMGLPVVGAILTDRRTGKVLVRFGAHPRFETALERCLTEQMQGRHIERLEHTPEFDLTRDDKTGFFENRFNFAKAACGMFPSEIFAGAPSWEYTEFKEVGEDTDELYDFMLGFFSGLSFHPYVRDCSFTGFPTYHIIVPGMSMVFDFGSQRLSEKRSLSSEGHKLRNLASKSWVERDEILSFVLKKRGWMLENGFGYLTGVPIWPKLEDLPIDANIISALILMSENDYAGGANLLKGYMRNEDGGVSFAVPLVQAALITAGGGTVNTDALEQVYPYGWGKRAMEIIKDPLSALPELNCPDCGTCPHSGVCAMPKLAPSYRKFFELISSSH
jgi:ribosomal protein S12 methylthiotransferase accessory factor